MSFTSLAALCVKGEACAELTPRCPCYPVPLLTYSTAALAAPSPSSQLAHLLNHPEYSEVIRWNREGTAFTFAHGSPELLTVFSRFFRHSNVHSFVRQLNICTLLACSYSPPSR